MVLRGQCKVQVEADPWKYDGHIALLGALRTARNTPPASLRAARENFATHFPLSPALWLQWYLRLLPLL